MILSNVSCFQGYSSTWPTWPISTTSFKLSFLSLLLSISSRNYSYRISINSFYPLISFSREGMTSFYSLGLLCLNYNNNYLNDLVLCSGRYKSYRLCFSQFYQNYSNSLMFLGSFMFMKLLQICSTCFSFFSTFCQVFIGLWSRLWGGIVPPYPNHYALYSILPSYSYFSFIRFFNSVEIHSCFINS